MREEKDQRSALTIANLRLREIEPVLQKRIQQGFEYVQIDRQLCDHLKAGIGSVVNEELARRDWDILETPANP